jgi:hypothetical protein
MAISSLKMNNLVVFKEWTMKNKMKEMVLCATICLLFVLAVFVPGHVGILGAATTGTGLVTGAMPAPDAGQSGWMAGPFPVPEPIDWPVQAKLAAGPVTIAR